MANKSGKAVRELVLIAMLFTFTTNAIIGGEGDVIAK
jgi:hypothetical protein